MADQTALVRVFADYARTISRPYEIGEVLYRLTDQVVDVLDIDDAGVSLAEGAHLEFVTASNDDVVAVEEGQVQLTEGPCYEAFRAGEPVTSVDLTVEDRWPGYTALANEHGYRSVAGIPMRANDTVIGALNLYRDAPAEWPADELEIAQVLAGMASGYIVNARILTASQRLAGQLQHALDSRVIIEQAKGLLAGRVGRTPEEAFDDLRSYARDRGRKLHDVAREIVDGELEI